MEETPRQQGNEPLDSNQVIEARLEARRRSFLPEANDQDPLYSHDREIMLAALGDRARALDDYLRHTPQNAALSMPPGSQTQTPQTTYHVSVAREVYEAAKRFVIEPLPINVSDVLFRFLCVSAGEGLWEKLERDYPPLPTILIRYYFQGATLASLTELASSTSLGHISHLISSTTDYLWERMDERPWAALNKAKEFPPNLLRRSRKGLSSQAQKQRWAADRRAGGAARAALSATLRRIAQNPEVREKRRQSQIAAWKSPEERQARIKSMRQRFSDPNRREAAYAQVRKASQTAHANRLVRSKKKRPSK